MKRPIFALLLSVSFARGAAGATISVPSGQPTIQEAIDLAQPGDLVLVAPGTYRGPGNRDLDFFGKAIRVESELGAQGAGSTIVDCEGAGRGFFFHSGEGPDSVVLGLSVRNGFGDLGGAVCCLPGSSPSFRNCWFIGCSATGDGGGVYAGGSSAPSLEGCLFSENSAFYGGGMHCEGTSPSLTDCEFSRNLATSGGGINCQAGAAPVLKRCTIASNRAVDGGGIYLDSSSPVLIETTLSGNSAAAGGGGFFLVSSPALTACRVVGNSARETAGGLCFIGGSSPVLANCLIVGNGAGQGGGFSSESLSDLPRLVNCTLHGNFASLNGGGFRCHPTAFPRLGNCIVWGNTPEVICGELTCSLTDEDPRFVRPGEYDHTRLKPLLVGGQEFPMPDFVIDAGDYSLRDDSPARDAGCAEDAPAVDITGRGRCEPGTDLGAYEFCYEEVPRFRRGDVNGDGTGDLSDAAFILSVLFLGGSDPSCLKTADVDDSGALQITDPILLLDYLFLGGPPPADPYSACGVDPTPDGLGCERSAASCG